MNSLQSMLNQLRDKGYRITRSRKQVLKVLLNAERGINRQEIVRTTREKGQDLDPVSAYRTLLWLEEQGLAHKLPGTNAYIACRLAQNGCHHYVICENCGKVAEVPCSNLDMAISGAESYSTYKIKTHQLEFRGLCPACSNGSSRDQ